MLDRAYPSIGPVGAVVAFFCFGARGAAPFVAAAALLVGFGCSAKSEDVGGETNWLVMCERDDDCPDMPCRCGVCTTECSAASDCGDLEAATCADGDSDATETQCGRSTSVGICLPECTRDSDCSSNQRCASGACVLPVDGSTPDDSMPPPDEGPADDSSADDSTSDDDPGDGASDVDNPTGDCVADGDGSRVGHSPGNDSVYLPDCELDLEREYYRVFAQSDGTAYMIPRPDGHPDFIRACIDDQVPLHDVLQAYSLCQSEALDSAQVEQVNSMAPADALQIAHYLHERLVFFVAEQGVSPYPQPQDILDLCKTDDDFRNGPMQERCDFELDAEESGSRNEIGWIHTGEQAEALAPALNALYGIESDELCDRLSNAASLDVTRVVYGTQQSCSSDEDCTEVGHASACHDSCSAVIATANQAEFDATVERVSNEQCATREAAECGPIIAPPCVPPLGAACVEGQCVEGQPAE